MDNDNFWERTKQLIKAHKMTQKQFAEYLGVPLQTLYGWIKHDRIPDTATAYEIAVVLGVTLDFLLGGSEADTADFRIRELAARDAAARILELAACIQEETCKLRPLMTIIPEER